MRLNHLCFLILFLISTVSCERKVQNEIKEKNEDCSIYKRKFERLKHQMIEAERNSDRLENVMYRVFQNYLLIDQKVRLIQKFKSDPSQEKLLKRTVSEINNFFSESQSLLDSTEFAIEQSAIPQSSLIPIIETIRAYLSNQKKLFIEVNGSIQSIKKQVDKLKETVVSKDKELYSKAKSSQKEMEIKAKAARKIYYLVGNKAELIRAKAISRKGGFLGIGSTIQLSDKLEELFFQTADYNIMKEIALGNTQNINLVTTHPKGTYLIFDTPGERFLKVTNPEKFWSTSKFMVVEVD